MLKARIIPILTFNGFALVKTRAFKNPRMVGNPVQTARIYNSRGVDELVFLDIFASQQKRKINLKMVKDVINECFMPVGIGGGIKTLADINDLLKIGADKVVIKSSAIENTQFISEAVEFFGSQCISIAVDALRSEKGYTIFNKINPELTLVEFLQQMEHCDVGEYIVTSVDNDGEMQGFDHELVNTVNALTNKPIIAVGGAGTPKHFQELFQNTTTEGVGAASLYHFTQYTPKDVKLALKAIEVPVRL